MIKLNGLKTIMCCLAVILLFLPSAAALTGESPADTFKRLTDELIVVIVAASFFCIVVGVLLIIIGASSPSLRAWGARLIVGVFIGNFVILAAPWFLDIIRPTTGT